MKKVILIGEAQVRASKLLEIPDGVFAQYEAICGSAMNSREMDREISKLLMPYGELDGNDIDFDFDWEELELYEEK